MDFREFSEAYNDYLMHSGSRPTAPTSMPGLNDRNVIEEAWRFFKQRGYRRLTIEDIYKNLSSSEIKDFARAVRSTDSLTSGEPYIKMAYERAFGEGSGDKPIVGKQNKGQYKNLSHNDFREYSDYLMHYGRKGMKWDKHIFGKDDRDPEGKRNNYLNEQRYEKQYGKRKYFENSLGNYRPISGQSLVSSPNHTNPDDVLNRQDQNFVSTSKASWNDRNVNSRRNTTQHREKESGKEVNALLRYAENPNWAKYIKAGDVDSTLWNDCISIVKNRNYNDSQKKAMINAKLRLWFNGNLYENSEYYAKKNGVTK